MQCSAGKPLVLEFLWVSLDTHLPLKPCYRRGTRPHGNATPWWQDGSKEGTWEWGWGIDIASKFPKIQIWLGIKRDVPEQLCHDGVGSGSGAIDCTSSCTSYWCSIRLGSGIFGGQVDASTSSLQSFRHRCHLWMQLPWVDILGL